MTALTVTAMELRRLVRDRTAIFFMVLLPIVIILVIGATAGNATAIRVGVVATDTGPLTRALVDDLHAIPGAQVTDPVDEQAARTALRRGELDAVVLIPADLDATLRAGGTVSVPVLGAGSQEGIQAAQSAVSGAVAGHATRVQAALFGVAHAGGTFEQQLATADRVRGMLPAIEVRSETVDADSDYLPRGFGYSAPTMLVLFVFINSLAGGAAIIQSRKLGIHRRVMAAPVRARDLVFGETLAYTVIGLLQSLLIVGVGATVFGVDWGDPTAAAALIGVWVLVGAGTGVLAGTLFSTPEQAAAIGPAIGIAFGMLGGTMWPLEIVTPIMRSVGHLVPHAWAVDGWVEVLSRGGGIAQIGTQLAVLGAFALVLLSVASVRLSRRVTE